MRRTDEEQPSGIEQILTRLIWVWFTLIVLFGIVCCRWLSSNPGCECSQMTEKKQKTNKKRTLWKLVIEPNTDLILQWCEEGLIDAAICASLKISKPTWYAALKAHPEFSDSVTRAKHIPNKQVTSALLERCLGIEYTETTREPLRMAVLHGLKGDALESAEAALDALDQNIKNAMVVTKTVSKFLPAEVTAMKFWLMNRERETWTKEGDATPGEVTVVIQGLYGQPGDIPLPAGAVIVQPGNGNGRTAAIAAGRDDGNGNGNGNGQH